MTKEFWIHVDIGWLKLRDGSKKLIDETEEYNTLSHIECCTSNIVTVDVTSHLSSSDKYELQQSLKSVILYFVLHSKFHLINGMSEQSERCPLT